MGHDQRGPTEEPAYRALRAIRRILRQVDTTSRQMLTETGLTLPQLLCLRALAEKTGDGVTVAELAGEVQISSPTMSGIVERLVRGGLVSRDRSERDRRRVAVRLTEAGRARLQATPLALQDRFVARMGALPAAQQLELLNGLERVVELLEATDLDADPLLVAGSELLLGAEEP